MNITIWESETSRFLLLKLNGLTIENKYNTAFININILLITYRNNEYNLKICKSFNNNPICTNYC